jgi:hypothetical protein
MTEPRCARQQTPFVGRKGAIRRRHRTTGGCGPVHSEKGLAMMRRGDQICRGCYENYVLVSACIADPGELPLAPLR